MTHICTICVHTPRTPNSEHHMDYRLPGNHHIDIYKTQSKHKDTHPHPVHTHTSPGDHTEHLLS
jgi:hypothetical protein